MLASLPVENIAEAVSSGGEFERLYAKAFVVFTYEIWNDVTRNQIAATLRLEDPKHVKCDLVGDLRFLRNWLIHPTKKAEEEFFDRSKILSASLGLSRDDPSLTAGMIAVLMQQLNNMNRTGFLGDLITWEDGVMGRPSRFSPEVRERAVRMVEEHREAHASEWAVLQSVAPKLGCTAETLRKWVRQAQRDTGYRPGLTTSERERLKELEREVRELKRANEILRKASAYFAQAELDRRGK